MGNPRPRVAALVARRPLALLTLLFVTARVLYAAAGIRFDLSALGGPHAVDTWQLLDVRLLRTDLLSSVWHLDSQPPLFNLASGVLLRLPGSWQQPVAALGFAALGLVMVLSAYSAMVDLGVPVGAALALSALVTISPAFVLYENWYSYAYPSATLLTLAVLCCIRYLRTGRATWGLGLFGALSAVVLLNSTYQVEWLLVVVAVVVVARRPDGRRALLLAALPVVAVGGWYAKDAVMFGTSSTSSWLGMNLAKTTLASAPPGQVAQLVRRGTLPAIAGVATFSPVAAYEPRFVRVPRTGVPALDSRFKASGANNYNNLVYPSVSGRYLGADLAYVAAEPLRYARTVLGSGSLWFTPTDDYPFLGRNARRLSAWRRLYDVLTEFQVEPSPNAGLAAAYSHVGPGAAELGYGTLLLYLVVVLGAPVAAWRRRLADRPAAATMVLLWCTVVYALASTTFIEIGDNQRFRFELGPLPLIAAAAALSALLPSRRPPPPGDLPGGGERRAAQPGGWSSGHPPAGTP